MATSWVISNFENIGVENEGDLERYRTQLIDLIPRSWTTGGAKIRGGMLWAIMTGIASVATFCKTTLIQVKRQLRISTASNGSLDAISLDFFGDIPPGRLPRLAGEGDEAYRTRLVIEITREKVTVEGISTAVEYLTGAKPQIFEPFNAVVAACWDDPFGVGLVPFPYAPYPSACLGSESANQFQLIGGASSGSLTPNPGIGAIGDTTVIYTFFVNILNNPNNIPMSTIQLLVDRIRGMGIRGIVQGS